MVSIMDLNQIEQNVLENAKQIELLHGKIDNLTSKIDGIIKVIDAIHEYMFRKNGGRKSAQHKIETAYEFVEKTKAFRKWLRENVINQSIVFIFAVALTLLTLFLSGMFNN